MKAKTMHAYLIRYVDDSGHARTIMIESQDALSAYEAAVAAYDAIEAAGRRMITSRPEAAVE